MPNLPTHVELAWRARREFSGSHVDQHLGYYLLGATAPDVRIITKRARRETHFFDLRTGRAGDGVSGLLEAHPELLSPTCGRQAAFIAGYISHLVADETWIISMYRQHFASSSKFGSLGASQLFDRAAQLVLDQAVETSVKSLLTNLDSIKADIHFGPLSSVTISDWHAWIISFLGGDQAYRWERLRHMAKRISGQNPEHPVHEVTESFLSNVSGGLQRLYKKVPRSTLDGYEDEALMNLTRAITDYFGSIRNTSRSFRNSRA